jgi:hypothetical protein
MTPRVLRPMRKKVQRSPGNLLVDLLEEERDLAAQRSPIYQQYLHRYQSRRV